MAHTMRRCLSFVGHQRKTYLVGAYLHEMPCYSNHGGSQRTSHGGFFKTHGRPHSSVPGGPNKSHYGDSHANHKVSSYIFHHGGFNTLHHVGSCHLSNGYGDLKKNRVSRSHGGDIHSRKHQMEASGFLKEHGKCIIKGKETMRLLNDRLPSYLGKIRSLEQKNAQLEKMISEWHENNSPKMPIDKSQYSRDIQELQNQISSIITENTRIVRQIDNSRVALDDFNKKNEMEHNLRSNIEADVKALRRTWEGCKEETGKLESEVESLEQELLRMRRDSEQEINSLTTELGPRVSVEVEAAKSKDLTKALFNIREQYEDLIESNQRKAESVFIQMAKKLNQAVVTGATELQSVQAKIINLQSSVQTMEIELQSEQNMISVLQDILAEKKGYYSADIILMQTAINIVEDQLQQNRSKLQSLYETSELLSKHKMHLEITAYQQLLEEQMIHMTEQPPLCMDNVFPSTNEVHEVKKVETLQLKVTICPNSARPGLIDVPEDRLVTIFNVNQAWLGRIRSTQQNCHMSFRKLDIQYTCRVAQNADKGKIEGKPTLKKKKNIQKVRALDLSDEIHDLLS